MFLFLVQVFWMVRACARKTYFISVAFLPSAAWTKSARVFSIFSGMFMYTLDRFWSECIVWLGQFQVFSEVRQNSNAALHYLVFGFCSSLTLTHDDQVVSATDQAEFIMPVQWLNCPVHAGTFSVAHDRQEREPARIFWTPGPSERDVLDIDKSSNA